MPGGKRSRSSPALEPRPEPSALRLSAGPFGEVDVVFFVQRGQGLCARGGEGVAEERVCTLRVAGAAGGVLAAGGDDAADDH